MADTPKVVSTAAPRYIHGIQSSVNASDAWLTPRIQAGEQATLMDSYTDYGTTTVEGDLYVMSSSDGPTHHNSLSGRSDPDAHPASAIANTPTGTISAITVQNAINELASEKAQLAGTLTNMRVITADASGYLTDNANFFYDSTLGLRVSNTTAATSTTSGSLVLGGGLGLGGAIYGGASDYSSVHILFGAVQFWRGTSRWQMRVAGGSNELGQLGAVFGLTSMAFGMGGTSAGNGSYVISRSTGAFEFYCGTTSIFAGQFDAAGDFKVNNTTASTSTTTGALVVSGGVGCADYFTGKYRSSDGTAGLTATRTFYAASSSGGTVNVLNTVTIKDGIITAWTQA